MSGATYLGQESLTMEKQRFLACFRVFAGQKSRLSEDQSHSSHSQDFELLRSV